MHDLTDFQEQMQEVTEPIFERCTVFALNLEVNEAETVREIANTQGLGAEEFICRWVREKIQD